MFDVSLACTAQLSCTFDGFSVKIDSYIQEIANWGGIFSAYQFWNKACAKHVIAS